jgi:hydrogenase maturation factor
MTLLTGEVVEVYLDDGRTMARVSIGGAFMRVPLMLVSNVKAGDLILIESGVAIARVQSQHYEEERDVSGNPWQSRRN